MSTNAVILDIRPVPPPQKHPTIFNTFESLAIGGTMQLINDHDPKPLYYQFDIERPGTFTWEYVELGPVTWRVNIGRIA